MEKLCTRRSEQGWGDARNVTERACIRQRCAGERMVTTEPQTRPSCPSQGRVLACAHVQPMPSAQIPSWGLAQALLLASFFPPNESFYFSTRWTKVSWRHLSHINALSFTGTPWQIHPQTEWMGTESKQKEIKRTKQVTENVTVRHWKWCLS